MAHNERVILLVDDHDATRETLTEVIRELGHRVLAAPSLFMAMKHVDDHLSDIDLVLTDLKLPDGTGMELMRRMRQESPGTPVVM
ncbi:MAG: response regulator, partial [Planctomycetota bacterium]|nr:response regulator [Planctomycetota bacterium]